MCRAVRCQTCQKTTWAGCGLHVDQVRARVPDDRWCAGHDRSTAAAAGDVPLTWVRRLLGHRHPG